MYSCLYCVFNCCLYKLQESLLDQLESMENQEMTLQEKMQEMERTLRGKIVTLEVICVLTLDVTALRATVYYVVLCLFCFNYVP